MKRVFAAFFPKGIPLAFSLSLRQLSSSVKISSAIPSVFVMALTLTGCGEKSVWEMPPNVIGSASVDEIVMESRKSLGVTSSLYRVKLRDANPADLSYLLVSGRALRSDMERTIGNQVSIKCYREKPGESCYASGYSHQGRELIPPPG